MDSFQSINFDDSISHFFEECKHFENLNDFLMNAVVQQVQLNEQISRGDMSPLSTPWMTPMIVGLRRRNGLKPVYLFCVCLSI